MIQFEPYESWLPLRERAAQTTTPRHKALLNEVANHMEAEIKGQLDPLMATLTAEPIYHFWHVGPENMILQGYEAVAGFYQDMFARKGNQFHVVNERIMVDDHGVITEGKVRQIYKRQDLTALGVTQSSGQDIESSELWLSNTQLITVWPADSDAKLVGEDIYFGEDPMSTLTPFAAENLPSYYQG